jgi:hypothetical protein
VAQGQSAVRIRPESGQIALIWVVTAGPSVRSSTHPRFPWNSRASHAFTHHGLLLWGDRLTRWARKTASRNHPTLAQGEEGAHLLRFRRLLPNRSSAFGVVTRGQHVPASPSLLSHFTLAPSMGDVERTWGDGCTVAVRPALAAGAMHFNEHLITSDQFLIYGVPVRICVSDSNLLWDQAVRSPCPTTSRPGGWCG